jgi:hypothetical protein
MGATKARRPLLRGTFMILILVGLANHTLGATITWAALLLGETITSARRALLIA